MIELQDRGVVLFSSPYSESSVILEVFSRELGVRRGLVYGARKSKVSFNYQYSNIIDFAWKGKFEMSLGHFKAELVKSYWFKVKGNSARIGAINYVVRLARLLPINVACIKLYHMLHLLLEMIVDISNKNYLIFLVLFEFELMTNLGYGLNLTQCVVTGEKSNLSYVSPKTGRAVVSDVGKKYHDKVFILPEFLCFYAQTLDFHNVNYLTINQTDIRHGLKLMVFFLNKYVAEDIKSKEAFVFRSLVSNNI